MQSDKYVATTGVRSLTLITSIMCTIAITLYHSGSWNLPRFWTLVSAWLLGISSILGAIHCSRSIYAKWMRFAKSLQGTVVSCVFATCYLVVVPIFFLGVWIADPLGLRNGEKQETYWIKRRREKFDLHKAQRMG